MRTEQECRKADFEEGTPVLLADGQEWQLPRPRVRFAPSNDDSGFKVVSSRPDGGVFAGLLAKYNAVRDSDDSTVGDYARCELALGSNLLRVNYDVTEDEVAELLQFSYDKAEDPQGWDVREGVVGVVLGYGGPKRSAVGDGSPS